MGCLAKENPVFSEIQETQEQLVIRHGGIEITQTKESIKGVVLGGDCQISAGTIHKERIFK